jgi:hypothetical protein
MAQPFDEDGHIMTDPIAAGDILIERGTHLPNSLTTPSESFLPGWSAVKGGRPTFEKEIKQAGWTLFFMAGEIKTNVFGFDRQRAAQAALQRLSTIVKSQSCNCIEITDVTEKSFLKLPYLQVRAYARHLQPGLVFSGTQSNSRQTS